MLRGVEFTLAVGAYEGATREGGMKRQSKVTRGTRGHSFLCFLTVQDQTVNHVSDSADTEIQHNLFMIVQGREVTANYYRPPNRRPNSSTFMCESITRPWLRRSGQQRTHSINQWPTLFTSDRVTPVCPTNTSAPPVHLQLMPSFQASARGGAIQLFA